MTTRTFIALCLLLPILAGAVTFAAIRRYQADGRQSPGLVWCTAPGEAATAQFKRDYPELHISRAACDAANR